MAATSNNLGYALLRHVACRPADDELSVLEAFADVFVIDPGSHAEPDGRWQKMCELGSWRLYLAKKGTFNPQMVASAWPVLAERREFVGVDSSISLGSPLALSNAPAIPPEAAAPNFVTPTAASRSTTPVEAGSATSDIILGWPGGIGVVPAWDYATGDQVCVAIIDQNFQSAGTFEPGARTCESPAWLEPATSSPAFASTGHGAIMARTVRAVAPKAQLLFCPLARRTPLEVSQSTGHLMNLDLAVQIAKAVTEGKARIVLLAMSGSDWGVAPYLSELLWRLEEEGVVFVTSQGLGDENGSEDTRSWLTSNDDLQAHPAVVALSACDRSGRWARRAGAPLSCLGATVELAGPGDDYTIRDGNFLEHVDDTSLSAALVAGTAALMLERAGNLAPFAVRQLLRIGADLPTGLDDPSSTDAAATMFNDWDRTFHNLKVGYGNLNTLQACLAAADPVCTVLLATRAQPDGQAGFATKMAQAWMKLVEASDTDYANCYRKVRHQLVALVLAQPRLFDVAARLARHLRELVADPQRRWVLDAKIDGQVIVGHERLRAAVCDILRVVRRCAPAGAAAAWSEDCAKALPDAATINMRLAAAFEEVR